MHSKLSVWCSPRLKKRSNPWKCKSYNMQLVFINIAIIAGHLCFCQDRPPYSTISWRQSYLISELLEIWSRAPIFSLRIIRRESVASPISHLSPIYIFPANFVCETRKSIGNECKTKERSCPCHEYERKDLCAGCSARVLVLIVVSLSLHLEPVSSVCQGWLADRSIACWVRGVLK